MDPVTAATILGLIAGACIALGVIGKALWGTYQFIKRMETANQITIEFPEWQAKVNLAMKELHPNSGSSLKDQVTAINTKLCETNRKVDEASSKVDTLGNSLEEIRQEIMTHVADNQRHSQ